MSIFRRPSDVPLTGADCFLRAFDDEVRRTGEASHVSQLVLRLGPGFDLPGFQKALGDLVLANPILHAPILRPLGMAPPVYRIGAARAETAPRLAVHEERGARGETLPEIFFQRMNQRLRGKRGELLRADAVRYRGGDAGTDLALSWLHMLFDGSGSEHFVEWLEACFRGTRAPDDLPWADAVDSPGVPDGMSSRERGRWATEWQRVTQGMASRPPSSLAGPLRRQRQRLRYDLLTLDVDRSAAVVAEAKRRAGFLTPMLYYLALAIRAHHAVFRLRGVLPASYVVPLPVNLRAKGARGAVFRTRVSLLWFQVSPDLVLDLDALLAELKAQRRTAIRAKRVEKGAIAMDFARHAPSRLYAHMARRSLRGELCSFFFAFTGEFAPELSGSFFGAPVENAFHAAPVPPSPGSSVAFSLRAGRLNVNHVRQQAVFADAELRCFREQLLADLSGSG